MCRHSSNKWNGEKDEVKVVVEEGEKDVVAEMVSGLFTIKITCFCWIACRSPTHTLYLFQ